MKIPKNIKKQNLWWRILPWLSLHHGTTIVQTIYLRPDLYEELFTEHPSYLAIRTVIHEQMHVKRIKKAGAFIFALKYFLSPQFRYQEELAGYIAPMSYLKKEHAAYDLERIAKVLSSWIYLWSVDYHTAKNDLENAWKNA